MVSNFKIRTMTLEDLDKMMPLSIAEGWPFNYACMKAFYSMDPKGFFVGELDGKPIGYLVVTKCGDYCHSPCYVVEEAYRKEGYGTMLQGHSLKYHSQNATIGIDVAPKNVASRQRIGFEVFGNTPIYKKKADGVMDDSLVDLRKVDLELIKEFDNRVFGEPRGDYVNILLEDPKNHGLALIKDKKIMGFGVIRKLAGDNGYASAPFFAEDKETARLIIQGLQSLIPGEELLVSPFEANKDAVELFKEDGWTLDVQEIRMYKGPVPKMNIYKIYGIFE